MNRKIYSKIRLAVRICLIITALLSFAANFRAQNCVSQPAGLISWWAAENNALDFHSRNNGKPQGNAAFATGKVGRTFSFNGNGGFVQVKVPINFPVGAAPRTVELWFKARVDLTRATESGIFQYGTASPGKMFGLITSGNAPGRLYFYGHSADLAGQTTLLPNTWYHAAVTYDGTTVRIYLNGKLEASAPLRLNTVMDANGLTIGNRPNSTFWNGEIDEPAIYARALSVTEIQSIFKAGSAGKCAQTEDELPNLAYRRPAKQSSRSNWSKEDDAQGAVDGIKNGKFGFHTNKEKNPWWQVDLGEVKKLTEVRIFNRLDCCLERARTIQVFLSNDGEKWTRVFTNKKTVFGGFYEKPLRVSVKGKSARYVRLQLNERNYFHLDEVEIY